MAALPAVEARRALTMARAIGMAATGEGLAKAVYEATGDGRLAVRTEVQQRHERVKRQFRISGNAQRGA